MFMGVKIMGKKNKDSVSKIKMESNKYNLWLLVRAKGILVGSIVFFILSLLYGALTLWGLGQGAIEEVNPVMRWFIEKSPITFMDIKLSLPVMLGFVLWEIRDRSRKFVAYSLWLVLVVYSIVMLFHGYWILVYE